MAGGRGHHSATVENDWCRGFEARNDPIGELLVVEAPPTQGDLWNA